MRIQELFEDVSTLQDRHLAYISFSRHYILIRQMAPLANAQHLRLNLGRGLRSSRALLQLLLLIIIMIIIIITH